MTLYATESAVEDWPAAEPPPQRPERPRGAEAVEPGEADHGLGPAFVAARRIADAAVRSLGHAPVGRVPLAVLGAALVGSVPGARFDADDPDDVAILGRILERWERRIARYGADVGVSDLAALRVPVARAPTRGDDVGIYWPQIATRFELARWARRAAVESAPVVLPVPAAVQRVAEEIAPDPDRLAVGYAVVREIRSAELAAGRPWPPAIIESGNGSVFSRTEHRPTVVANGLTAPVGCAGAWDGPRVPCVPVERARWVCPSCGTATPVPERQVGPRVPSCECWPAVCAHPGVWAGRSRRARGTR